MNILRNLFQQKPYLAWFVKDKNNLSKESMLEQVFNYGTWQDFLSVEKELGVRQMQIIFESLKNKKRTNLRTKAINYFNLYFAKYA